jgi:hypothetical protein
VIAWLNTWMGSMEDFSFSYEVHRSHASLCFTEWGETNFIVNFINIYLHISYYNNLFQLHPFSHWISLPFYVWLLRLVLKEYVKWKIYRVCLFVLIKSIKMWERTCFRKCEICSLNSVQMFCCAKIEHQPSLYQLTKTHQWFQYWLFTWQVYLYVL